MESSRIKSQPSTFKAYVDFGLTRNKTAQSSLGRNEDIDVLQPEIHLMPRLLPGEVITASAEKVLKFDPLSDLKKGISGMLICTNFKLSFITTEEYPSYSYQRNILLGENDICLLNIHCVYHVSGGIRKKISTDHLSGHVEILEVHCKDFRTFTFSFKFSSAEHSKLMTSAILHHAFVPKVQRLFLFDYLEPLTEVEQMKFNPFVFSSPKDWRTELERCGLTSAWRVTQVNEEFQLCESLPECFVVPTILLDIHLNKAAPHFTGHRVPIWCWGYPSGIVLIRMAAIDAAICDSNQESGMLDAIRSTSVRQQDVSIISVDELCPSIKDIQISFKKLKELCMPDSSQEFWKQDNHYLSMLESSKWLHHCSSCLQVAQQVSFKLGHEKESVVLKESGDRDLNCIIASLVQIMLDPYYRTRRGFRMLIQKEWIALGHPFADRLGHISGNKTEECPVFLLFLDCTWQLLQQCPSLFEFCETYLTTLWDSTHISVFDTFLFNCHKQRKESVRLRGLQLRSVFDWSKQFSQRDICMFQNPLYILQKYREMDCKDALCRPWSFSSVKDKRHNSQRRPLMLSPSKDRHFPSLSSTCENILEIDLSIKNLKFWEQCYLRWNPLTLIVGGGMPVVHINNLKLLEEIKILEKIINSLLLQIKQPQPQHRRIASDDYAFSEDLDYCKLQNNLVITSAFPFSPNGSLDGSTLHAIPSATYLQSYFESDENLDE